MGQKRQLVRGFDGFCGGLHAVVDIAQLLDRGAGFGRSRLERTGDIFRVECLARAFVPFNFQGIARGLRLPPGIGYHRNAVGDLHHVLSPGMVLALVALKLATLPPITGHCASEA